MTVIKDRNLILGGIDCRCLIYCYNHILGKCIPAALNLSFKRMVTTLDINTVTSLKKVKSIISFSILSPTLNAMADMFSVICCVEHVKEQFITYTVNSPSTNCIYSTNLFVTFFYC